MNSTAITVQWEMVPCIHRNGDITGYSVQYTGGGSTQTMSVSGDFSGGMVTISGLSPITMYLVQVAAVNSAGTGVYSDHMMISTPDSECMHEEEIFAAIEVVCFKRNATDLFLCMSRFYCAKSHQRVGRLSM